MFVIASNRPWHRGMAERLAASTGEPFGFLSDRSELTAANLARLGARTVFLPHWSYLIPADVFEQTECIIFHMTDLPFGRGGSPLQNLIVRGYDATVVSAIRCVAELDAGAVYMKRPLSLHGTAQEIFLRASEVIESMISDFVLHRPEPQPQTGEPVVFQRRTPAQGDWSDATTLDEVHDRIRMLDADGYPPAFLDIGGFRLEFTRASRRADAVLADVRIVPLDTVPAKAKS